VWPRPGMLEQLIPLIDDRTLCSKTQMTHTRHKLWPIIYFVEFARHTLALPLCSPEPALLFSPGPHVIQELLLCNSWRLRREGHVTSARAGTVISLEPRNAVR
jgi:hypothetical protein